MRLKVLSILLLLFLLVGCKSTTKMESKESSLVQMADIEKCRVTENTTEIRSGAGNSFNPIGTLKKDDVVNVVGQVGNWYVIQLDNNQVGCINTASAQPIINEGQPETTKTSIQQPQQPPQTKSAPLNNRENPVTQLTAEENQMVQLVNSERQKNNLTPLKVNYDVTRVARIKAQDMIDNNYFSHYSPTYGSPADMLDSFGIKYLQVGENIAANRSVQAAHTSLMGSAGHRQNILSPNYTDIGIGIKPDPKGGYILSQMFITVRK